MNAVWHWILYVGQVVLFIVPVQAHSLTDRTIYNAPHNTSAAVADADADDVCVCQLLSDERLQHIALLAAEGN